MKNCPYCDQRIADNRDVCPFCNNDENHGLKNCPHCDALIKEGALKCKFCKEFIEEDLEEDGSETENKIDEKDKDAEARWGDYLLSKRKIESFNEYVKNNPKNIYVRTFDKLCGIVSEEEGLKISLRTYGPLVRECNNKLNSDEYLTLFRELRETICNYSLREVFEDLINENKSNQIPSSLNWDAIEYIKENYYKMARVPEVLELYSEMGTDRKIFSTILLIFLSRGDYTFDQVSKMRGLFGIRRNLSKPNQAIIINNLFENVNKEGINYHNKLLKELGFPQVSDYLEFTDAPTDWDDIV